MFFFTFIKKTVKKHAKNIKLQYQKQKPTICED